MENKYTNNIKGLHTDNDEQYQPENTYRFALNAVNNSYDATELFLSNESSNELKYELNEILIIGDVYVGDNQTLLFVVHKTSGESGILLDNNNTLETIIPLTNLLNLSKYHKVYGTFRKIRGCEKIVYFTDNYNKPRNINLNHIENYFNDSILIPEKLNLIADYSIPDIIIKTINGNGILYAGSYNVAIQYLNQDLNGTNWVTTSDTVNVYSSNISSDYSKINGTYNKDRKDNIFDKLFIEEKCNKSIEININHKEKNIETFLYFRIAIIIARANTKNVTEVLVSNEYPISDEKIIYTGNNEGYYKITKEEIFPDKVDIETVKHITQLDNRLLLANGKGKQIDWCSFQQTASSIKTDYVIENVRAFDNSILENPKSANSVKMGFMGGEVYAFGIVYVFEDGTLSPVYHIPGRPNTMNSPISNLEFYEVVDNTYVNRDTISGNDYWGVDYWGNNLTGEKIRHHKLPDRNQERLVYQDDSRNGEKITQYYIRVNFTTKPASTDFPLYIIVKYKKNDDNHKIYKKTVRLEETNYNNPITIFVDYDKAGTTYNDSDVSVKNKNWTNITEYSGYTEYNSIIDNPTLQTNIRLINIVFSNITYPDSNIVGHFIVVGERDSENRTIIDKGIVQSLIIGSDDDENLKNRYLVHAYFNNSMVSRNKSRYHIYAKSPKILFEKDPLNPYNIYIEGVYRRKITTYKDIYQVDALPGTSSKGVLFGLITTDPDGMDWNLGSKFTSYSYKKFNELGYSFPDSLGSQNSIINKSVYLRQGEKIKQFYNDYTLVNTELDSQIGVMSISTGGLPYSETNTNKDDLFYVSFKNGNEDIHPVLENIKYFKTHANIKTGNSTNVKEGDIYIQHFPLTHSTYYKSTIKRRIGETIANIITMMVLTTGAVLLSIFTAGVGSTSIVLALALWSSVISGFIGIGAQILSEIIKDIDTGELRNYISNSDFNNNTAVNNAADTDDTVNYVGEHIENIFVESDINVALRLKIQESVTSYYDSIGFIDLEDYFRAKYLANDESREDDDNILTLLPAGNSEIYSYNKDYSRQNKEKVFFPIPLTYKCTSNCLEVWKNRIVWSQRNHEETRTDNYKVFLPNNYRDIPNEYGEITDIKTLNNVLFIFTDRMLYKIPANIQQQLNTEFNTFIGTGEFLSLDPQKMVDDDIGECGTRFKDSILKYKSSIFFVDDKAKSIYLITSEGLKNLSMIGMDKWFKNNLGFEALKINNMGINFPLKEVTSDFQGIGYIVTVDESTNRIIITKKDYTLNEINFHYYFDEINNIWIKIPNQPGTPIPITENDIIDTSFTISFSLNSFTWTSFHSYLPYYYYRKDNNFNSVIITNNNIYSHNKFNEHCNFYGNNHDFIIDLIIPIQHLKQFTDDFLYIDTKATIYNNDAKSRVELRKNFFDSVIFYNSYQCSGEKNLNVKLPNSTWLEQQTNNVSGNILVSKREGTFNLNEIRDFRINYDLPVFDKNKLNLQSVYFIDKIVNTIAIDLNKSWNEIQSFRDNYLGIRLYYNNTPNDIEFKLYYLNGIKNISNT